MSVARSAGVTVSLIGINLDDKGKKLAEKLDVKVKLAKVAPVEAKKKDVPVEKADSKAIKVEVPVAEPEEVSSKEEPEVAPAENVDDLLAAVEAMRAKRPGLRARKLPPSAEEMDRRRQQLCETVGRILVSL